MTETATESPTVEAQPVVTALDADTRETCDSCPAANAVFSVLLPTGSELTFCRHCAIKHRFATHDTHNWVHEAEGRNRNQGSAHA